MPIGWMTILSNVPWSEVIKNAPVVAEGARKLWKKVGSRTADGDEAVGEALAGASPDERLCILEARVEALHGQMLAAGEVIGSLAEQNAQLIVRVEKTRRRLLWLALVNVALAGGLLFALVSG